MIFLQVAATAQAIEPSYDVTVARLPNDPWRQTGVSKASCTIRLAERQCTPQWLHPCLQVASRRALRKAASISLLLCARAW